MKKFNLDICFFPGFYGTIYDCVDNEITAIETEMEYQSTFENHGLSFDDFVFDWDAYKKAVAENFVDAYALYAKEIPFIKAITFDEIESPRFYNFTTDKIYCWFEFADSWKDDMRKFMDENYDWLKNIIHEEHTSRSGFISFMDNDIDDWYNRLFVDEENIYIEDMIKYMIMSKNNVEEMLDDINMSVYENLIETDFVSIKEKSESNV